MKKLPIDIPNEDIFKFCRGNHISRLALFGSVLSRNFRRDSDIDFLVEFEPNHSPSLFGIVDMEEELQNIFGRPVDLRTKDDLSPFFRNEVIKQAVPIYE